MIGIAEKTIHGLTLSFFFLHSTPFITVSQDRLFMNHGQCLALT